MKQPCFFVTAISRHACRATRRACLVCCTFDSPRVTASASDPAVKVEVIQPVKWGGEATVKCDYNGAVKTYHVKFQ